MPTAQGALVQWGLWLGWLSEGSGQAVSDGRTRTATLQAFGCNWGRGPRAQDNDEHDVAVLGGKLCLSSSSLSRMPQALVNETLDKDGQGRLVTPFQEDLADSTVTSP